MPTLETKYMRADEIRSPNIVGLTRRWEIRSNNAGNGILGMIRWYGPWRQYCFFPSEGTVFNSDCMASIVTFLLNANWEHHEARKHRHDNIVRT